MDVHTSSSGLQHIVGYGPHSVVLSYPNHHNHAHAHTHTHQHRVHSLPPRSLPKATTSYEIIPLVPVVPTTIYMPVEQKKQQHQYQPSKGNHHRLFYGFKYDFSFPSLTRPISRRTI